MIGRYTPRDRDHDPRAQGLVREGAFVVVGTQNERLRDRVARMADEKGISGSIETLICDVCCDDNVGSLAEAAGELDTVVHSVAFASPAAMKGSVLNVTREDFRDAHAVSAYSFVCLARHTLPRLRPNASLMCMSYLGAHRVRQSGGGRSDGRPTIQWCRHRPSTASWVPPKPRWRPACERWRWTW